MISSYLSEGRICCRQGDKSRISCEVAYIPECPELGIYTFDLRRFHGVQTRSCAARDGAQISVQLQELELSAVAAALMAWADTLTEVTLSVWRPPSNNSVHLQVFGRLAGGVPIEVWAGVKAPVWTVSMEPGQTQTLPLGLLRTWAATPAAEQPTANAQAGGAA